MRRSWMILFAALTLSACVETGPRITDLAVPAPGIRAPIGGAEAVGIKLSVTDLRAEKAKVGVLQSALDAKVTRDLLVRQPVDQVIAKGIEAEFKARGFRMAEGPAFLLVDIQKVDCSATWYLGRTAIWGEAVLTAQVLNADGKVLYSNVYKRRDSTTNNVAIGHYDEGKDQLEAVLVLTIRSMAEDDNLIQALVTANRKT
jgi:hypothetical protein